LEWRNIKTIILQVADVTLKNYKTFTQNKNKKWEDEIKLIAQQENSTYKTYLQKIT
jgi:hypothetical protein